LQTRYVFRALCTKQAQEIGGHVRKGEHGSPGVFWKWLDKGEENQAGDEENTRRVHVARLYTVFNVQQCELPERLQPFLKIDNALGDETHKQIAACE
jgi:antirestriction protein ArdC